MDQPNENTQTETLLVGQLLYGFCGGYLEDHYCDYSRVEAVGADWVVTRDERGRLYFGEGADIHTNIAATQTSAVFPSDP